MWKKESERRVEESERKEESWGEKEKVYQTILSFSDAAFACV